MLGAYDEDIAARMAHVEATPPRFDLTAVRDCYRGRRPGAPRAGHRRRRLPGPHPRRNRRHLRRHHHLRRARRTGRRRRRPGPRSLRATALASHVAGTAIETIFTYHADTVALG